MTSHQIQSTAQVSRDPQITQSILPYSSSSGQIIHKSPAQAAEIDRPECDSSKGDSVLGPSPPVAVSSSRTEMPVSTHDTGRKTTRIQVKQNLNYQHRCHPVQVIVLVISLDIESFLIFVAVSIHLYPMQFRSCKGTICALTFWSIQGMTY